jgi:hypothetical protein
MHKKSKMPRRKLIQLDAGQSHRAANSCLQKGNLHLFNTIQQIDLVWPFAFAHQADSVLPFFVRGVF